ncbi:uncharacterized protein E0L32_009985 [Thyridium curvatum]|uniref:Acyl-coenzyme A oxidase n=1 Tax=Thyridium curvatum TaxID=1093900 RepID=A0A507AUG1_9PEZI|nr:uncharacterized protein E0L32_009985 [Thyridium curvatum]TPX08498.1 hypothetical protein E0L32_009985 [Thyridium curvatum]
MANPSTTLPPAGPKGLSILDSERMQSGIDTDNLAHHLLGCDGFRDRQKRILTVLEQHPLFCKRTTLHLSRVERFHLGLARAKELRRLSRRFGWSNEDDRMAEYLLDEVSPFALTHSLFSTSILEQGTDEQRSYWLPKVDRWEIVGCYAQTELAHGSNVQGIECQAEWNPATRDFTIHSPKLTSAKWWNGGLGRLADHAIVVAQLLVPDTRNVLQRHGPHLFIVQIRDMNTRQPLPGITIGDIGPKYGYATMDNGYMLFHHFRVPFSAMLARHSSIDAEGRYRKPANRSLLYGTMTSARAQIVSHARLVLARAVTIAIRYTLVRRQFRDRDAGSESPEEQVLNYPTVQIRILPLLAAVYALHYTGEAMSMLYESSRKRVEEGDGTALAGLHASSSGLKALCTTIVADGIETCRRVLGGHGYGPGSGLTVLNADYLAKATVEGDNWMITQQTASYLIKKMQKCVESDAAATSMDTTEKFFRAFIAERADASGFCRQIESFTDPVELLRAFRYRTASLAYHAYVLRVAKGAPWTEMMILLRTLSNAHCQTLLVEHFAAGLNQRKANNSLYGHTLAVLETLFRLFALHTLEVSVSEFLEFGILVPSQLDRLREDIRLLMQEVRPHAAKLVDAWEIPDYLIAGSLGKYAGNVYEELFQAAHYENPLNGQNFNAKWESREILLGEGEEAADERISAMLAVKTSGRDTGAPSPKL